VGQRTDLFDLGRLGLSSGEGRRLELTVGVERFEFGGQDYAVRGGSVPVTLEVARTSSGYSLRLRYQARLEGPCMRCLEQAERTVEVDAREVDQPGEAEELHSPYVDDGTLELAAWARDALVLALPAKVLCRDECRGLCAICGADLNTADPEEHRHEDGGDPRWSKLRELKL
jgi:uncharacterized protein